MVHRTPIVGGNWKMNLHRDEALSLSRALADRLGESGESGESSKVETVIFPPFLYLAEVEKVLAGSPAGAGRIKLGAQDCYHQSNGAYTGEVSMSMLKDVGVAMVLVGHSERRHVIGEGDELVNHKLRAALDAGLEVTLCVGEKIDQREANQTDAINAAQTQYGLAGVDARSMARVTIAYEPVWAIGTGKTATTDDAQNAHEAIRHTLAEIFNEEIAQSVRIQYGGSVKPANALELFGQPDIDGGLIGGASLQAEDFLAIIDAAAATAMAPVG